MIASARWFSLPFFPECFLPFRIVFPVPRQRLVGIRVIWIDLDRLVEEDLAKDFIGP